MTHELDPDAIQKRMNALRNSLDFDVERVASSVRAKTDWRYLVRSHPWLTLATAAAFGYLVVPRRVEKIVPDTETLTKLAREGKIMLVPQGISERKKDSIGSKLFAVALAMGSRAAVGYATNFVNQTLAKARTTNRESEQYPAYMGTPPK